MKQAFQGRMNQAFRTQSHTVLTVNEFKYFFKNLNSHDPHNA